MAIEVFSDLVTYISFSLPHQIAILGNFLKYNNSINLICKLFIFHIDELNIGLSSDKIKLLPAHYLNTAIEIFVSVSQTL